MRQGADPIFVVVAEPMIIALGVADFVAHQPIAVLHVKTADEMEQAAQRDGAIPVISFGGPDGPSRAVRIAASGARAVICAGGPIEREAELKALAPASFVLRAATAEELAKALRIAFLPQPEAPLLLA